MDELALYQTNRPAWLAIAAPRVAARIETDTDDAINAYWPLMSDDFKAAVWALLPEAQRERIRKVRETK